MRALRVSVLAFVVCGAAGAGVLAAIIPAHPVPINVRWRPEVGASQRAALEDRFHLTRGEVKEGTTWAYELDVLDDTKRAVLWDFTTDRALCVGPLLGDDDPRGGLVAF